MFNKPSSEHLTSKRMCTTVAEASCDLLWSGREILTGSGGVRPLCLIAPKMEAASTSEMASFNQAERRNDPEKQIPIHWDWILCR